MACNGKPSIQVVPRARKFHRLSVIRIKFNTESVVTVRGWKEWITGEVARRTLCEMQLASVESFVQKPTNNL